MEFKVAASAVGIALVIAYAVGSGIWVNSSPGWYSALNRPAWQPPSFVFGLIWPYNFIILGVCAFQVAHQASKNEIIIWLSGFAISVVTALIWAYQFYVPHNLYFAAFALVTTAILTIPMLVITYRVNWKLGALLTPYQLWVAIAASLALSYAAKN